MKAFTYYLRIVALVPFLAGLVTWIRGLHRFPDLQIFDASVDSDLRFLAGIIIGMAMLILWTSLKLKEYGQLLYIIFGFILFGTAGRVVSYVEFGEPGTLQKFIFVFATLSSTVGLMWLHRLRKQGLVA